MGTFDSLQASCNHLRPAVFVVLGSGMNHLIDDLPVVARAPFAEVPGLPPAGVAGHRGELVLVHWAGRPVLVSLGRLHHYEGHLWEAVVRPIQLAASLGVRAAILTNAAGGIREDLTPGSLMPLRDHLDWNRPNPWREPPGPSPYSPRLVELTEQAGAARAGIYAAVRGPNYETPAEIRALRSCGADAVGMSTAREAMAGREAGLEVAALSLITNRAAGLSDGTLSHDEVMETARAAAADLAGLIGRLLPAV